MKIKFIDMDNIVFSASTLPIYALGLGIEIFMILTDWLLPSKELKTFKTYIAEFMYALVSIVLGVVICLVLNTSQEISYLVSILAGLFGSTVVRKVRARKDAIADKVADAVEHKVEDKINTL